jgi:hypothetical protein
MRAVRTLIPMMLLTMSFGAVQADWKSDLKAAAKQQAGAKMEQTLGLANPAPAGSSAYLINLKDGDTVTSPFLVQFGLKAAGVSPAGLQSVDTGHHHLLIDDVVYDATLALPLDNAKIKHFDKGETETLLSLPAGTHTIQLLVADWKQQSFNPALQSAKISITVKAGAAAPAPAKK